MARIFVTGSTDGIGLAAARQLLEDGHEIVLHARNEDRANAVSGLIEQGAQVVLGDLASGNEVRGLADQVNEIGTMDVVIHNAAVNGDLDRTPTPEGHARTIAVNALAPYMLTCLVNRPGRLMYISGGLNRQGETTLEDVDWLSRTWDPVQAYANCKLYLTSLGFAIARLWPDVVVSLVDPGWVPTRMGGPDATDDLESGYATQVWLATSDDPAVMKSGGFWYHHASGSPNPAAHDEGFQNRVLGCLAALSGVALP
jgi:NAD(P)-dependent dehydrogenase (short-subunit alcohol dehydrogenase family)